MLGWAHAAAVLAVALRRRTSRWGLKAKRVALARRTAISRGAQ